MNWSLEVCTGTNPDLSPQPLVSLYHSSVERLIRSAADLDLQDHLYEILSMRSPEPVIDLGRMPGARRPSRVRRG